MPLPWKKTKVDQRVNRFVSDLRSSSKHGESLVVQTGFPTSLVDLFVKNRDRMSHNNNKKINKKKKKHQQLDLIPPPPRPDDDDDDLILFSDPLYPPPLPPHHSHNSINSIDSVFSGSVSVSSSTSTAPSPLHQFNNNNITSNSNQRFVKQVELQRQGEDVCVVPNRVFKKLCLTIFLMLMLALGTKKLVVGITLSAFLLIFLEFAGNRFIFCSEARKKLHFMFEKVLDSVQLEKPPTTLENNVTSKLNEDEQILIGEMNINQQPRRLNSIHDVVEFFDDIDETMMGEENNCEEIGYAKMPRTKRSKSLSAKSVKKYVLKKFRKKKKKAKGGDELDWLVGDEEEEEEEERLIVRDSSVGLDEDNEESDEDNDQGTQGDGSYSSNNSLLGCEENVARTTAKWSVEHCIPLVITLIGLVGGRIFALVLNVAWFLLINKHKLQREEVRDDNQGQQLVHAKTI